MAEERVQRRLAAILAADVAGYSRLMGEDEEGTLAALTAHRTELIEPCIAGHRGRVVKTTGDGLLVEFASVVDAVRCAVAFQEGMAVRNEGRPEDHRIEFRIGVNLGDVIVQDDDLFGDGVNVAARLEGLADPGAVVVSGKVHEEVRTKIDIGFDDLGPHEVKNITTPVRAYRIELPVNTDHRSRPDLALPEKPSIAVLPFQSMSGDPEQDYFSDGITEDIITELSRFRTLFVIARYSSFAFRGQNVDVAEIGRKLGVRYLVEGSVRKAAGRVRVTAELVDAATGHHLWAERYDRDLEDIFAVQDEITQTIVSTLPGRLEDADRGRAERERPANMSAYDYLLLGLEQFNRFGWERIAEARRLAQKAVDLDPRYGRAHALIAATHLWELPVESSKEGALDDALSCAETAVALDDEDSWAHAMLSLALFECRQDQDAEIQARRAVALNPNDADAAAILGVILVYFGRVDEGRDWIAKAMRLNPFPPRWYHWYQALACYSARDYDQAVGAIKQIRPLDRWFHAYLAACYAQMDRMEEARAEIAVFVKARQRELLEARSEPLRAQTLDLALERASRYRNKADRDHLLDGLRRAGLTG